MIADREFCQTLFEKSRWNDTYFQWINTYRYGWVFIVSDSDNVEQPAYDFNYMSNKLEQYDLVKHHDGRLEIYLYERPDIKGEGKNPVNAICRLCILMFQNRILKREEVV